MPAPRPSFENMAANFPSTNNKSRSDLYTEIGWVKEIDNPAFMDTCALRVSIALLHCKVPLAGRMKILAGPLKGKMVEPGQHRLTEWLTSYWGPPEAHTSRSYSTLAGARGVISFYNINPTSPLPQGHIDLLAPNGRDLMRCASMCYWGSSRALLWRLS